MDDERLQRLKIDPADRRRLAGTMWLIYGAVAAATAAAIFFAWPRKADSSRILGDARPQAAASPNAAPTAPANPSPQSDDVILTVTGYIINRERIELSPRFVGTVKTVNARKGDRIKKGQILAVLDDTDQRALLAQAEGRLERAEAELELAEIRLERVQKLLADKVIPPETGDDARLATEAARAAVLEARGARDYAKAQVEWTVIRSPIDGVILEKLVDDNELVTPQSFGGSRGPSTALLAIADPNDLQVEIDLNESDVAKVQLNQRCRVSPEAYPDKKYGGRVAEIAPEASREKGTLQIKVQIENPDRFLTPEASARVDFLKP